MNEHKGFRRKKSSSNKEVRFSEETHDIFSEAIKVAGGESEKSIFVTNVYAKDGIEIEGVIFSMNFGKLDPETLSELNHFLFKLRIHKKLFK
jgi:hypothetical protein